MPDQLSKEGRIAAIPDEVATGRVRAVTLIDYSEGTRDCGARDYTAERPNDPRTFGLRDYLAKEHSFGYELTVVVRPPYPEAAIQAMSAAEYQAFAACLGDLRFHYAPRIFETVQRNFERALYGPDPVREGRKWNEGNWRLHARANPYMPDDGPWYWIAPDGPTDWRTRARAIFPKPATIKRSLPDLLLHSRMDESWCWPPEVLDLTIEYEPNRTD